MIRHLHPTDSPRILQFRASAGLGDTCTLANALRGGPRRFPTAKYATIALSPRAWQNCWLESQNGKINGVLRAGPRSGKQAWEISELYLRNSKSSLILDLLEQIAVQAGGAGAYRIFIRIPIGSNASDFAQKAGFSTIYRETIYQTTSTHSAATKLGISEDFFTLRPRYQADDGNLFRMHNVVTPMAIRIKTGQTSEDWAAGMERLGPKSSEWILDLPTGEIGALIQTSTTRTQHMFNVNWATNAGGQLGAIVAAALKETDDVSAVTAVPDYKPSLAHLLANIGFKKQATYEVMVKPLTQPISEIQQVLAAVS